MGQRRTVNQKRLTRKEVQHLIDTEGKLHQEYTDFFEEKYVTGFIKRDKIYELSGDRLLYVFDENDSSIPGKGDIYLRKEAGDEVKRRGPEIQFQKWRHSDKNGMQQKP